MPLTFPEPIKDALNAPSLDEIYDRAPNYGNEILFNAIDGVVHVEAMRAAIDAFGKGELFYYNFIKAYQFEEHDNGLLVSLNAVIEPKEIFIPEQRYECEEDIKIALFTDKYREICSSEEWKGYGTEKVLENPWNLENNDLRSLPLITLGRKFGKAIWEFYLGRYEKLQKEKPDDEKITDYVSAFIEYCSQIINPPPKPEPDPDERLRELSADLKGEGRF